MENQQKTSNGFNKKLVVWAIVVIVILVALLILNSPKQNQNITPPMPPQNNIQTPGTQSNIKEFSMDSFTEMIDGKPNPKFSLKEIVVNKGDYVKININVKNGHHDFKIDEFNVYKDTPTGQITTVEFVADKAGEFIYYCNKPGHRAAGHWGTLKVIE